MRASACLILACLSLVFACKDAVIPACFFFARASASVFLACLSTLFFRLAACFGMFDFGMFKSFLLSTCCIPHTHTLAARCWSSSWSRGRAQLRFSNAVQRRHDRFCFLHADFHHVVLVVLFWSLWPLAQLKVADNSSSTHTTTTQLQLVSQGKDAVIGSSVVALVVLAQRGKKRSVHCNSFCFGDLSPTWKEAAEADIAEGSVTTTTTTMSVKCLRTTSLASIRRNHNYN